ncbi:uncharacterized protein Z518_03155 [Rhinocladiella mackenziei CBS 650.93]|uniref:NAD-dependent epimerase/dehydratase domain-containing protein n=1 Tax=Rhinocladiella mackenziei CBS 650.93 TaxID=1442369 RepID=A0A0D2IRC9_9EURO|nr:uncharacterized protein Z518_03155 [Rhinocladiella mackenziei CBS 650.93]KIX08499.1 hypothetical protein Z518_03155 [Rhinocladiella mackenziei CBS 650.93]
MSGKRVAFTGGSGKVGGHVVQELLRYGHEVINIDLTRPADLDIHTLKCDITDSGQVFSCLNTHMRLGEPFPSVPPRIPDAVVHFAGVPQPMIVSDGETFRTNVMGTHNVIEAACKLGIKKIIIASSITTYGVSFGQGNIEYPAFPVTEDMDSNPTDPYALSKICGERVARSYAARFGVDIYCLRIGRVFEPDEYDTDMFWGYVHEPEKWFQHGWSYTDARDLGQMCHRGLEVSGLGFQIFNAVNDTITNTAETADFLKKWYPHIPHTRVTAQYEAPISNRKIRDMLGFKEEHDWRKYFTRYGKTSLVDGPKISRDSSATYIHLRSSRLADVFEEFCRPPSSTPFIGPPNASNHQHQGQQPSNVAGGQPSSTTGGVGTGIGDSSMTQLPGHFLPFEEIALPPHLMPLNPEDEDDVVPDMHAAFGINRALGQHQTDTGGGAGGQISAVPVGGVGGSGGVTGSAEPGGEASNAGVQREPVWRDLGLEGLVADVRANGIGQRPRAMREGKRTPLLLLR